MSYRYDETDRIWIRKEYAGIGYSDGDEVERRLEKIVDAVTDRSALSTEFLPHVTDWASEYHFSRQRHCLLRPFDMKPGDRVLELGCGCGAITRYLGETGAKVVAVEGSPTRARIARKRCQGLDNVEIYSDNLLEFDAGAKRFDWVLLIGVLEYAPVYSNAPDPVRHYLEKAKRYLDEGGQLIVAIENRLGLKYFNGRPEDHVGKPFYGLSDRYERDEPVTFGRRELQQVLADAGFERQSFHYPFPDYKLPSVVLSDAGLQQPAFNAGDLLSGIESRDYLGGVPPLFPEPLVAQSIYRNDLLADLANSFLVVASCETRAAGGAETEVLARYYSIGRRKTEFCTQTLFALEEGKVVVSKSSLVGHDRNDDLARAAGGKFLQRLTAGDYALGSLSILDFMKVKMSARSEQALAAWFRPWFEFVRGFASPTGDDEGRLESWRLPGDMLDAVPSNTVVTADGFRLIDQEWLADGDIPLGWLLYRAVRWTLPLGLSETMDSLDGVAIFATICDDAGLSFERGSLEEYAELERELMRFANISGDDIPIAIDSIPSSVSAFSEVLAGRREQAFEANLKALREEVEKRQAELVRLESARLLDNARYQSLLEQHEHICRLHARERHTVIRPLLRLGYRSSLKLIRKLPLSTKIRLKTAAMKFLPAIGNHGDSSPLPVEANGDGEVATLSAVWREPVLSAGSGRGDIIVFPVIDWDFRFQRPQHLAAGLAERGFRVFYLTTAFFAADRPGFRVESSPQDNLFIVRLGIPAPPPDIYTSALSGDQLHDVRAALLAMYESCEIGPAVALINLPFWRPAASGLPSTITVYDCMDHHAGFSTNAADVQAAEEEKLLREASLVITTSSRLQQNLQPVTGSLLIRNAGDIGFFSQRPDRLAFTRDRPVVGYYGAISDWFDVDLVRQAAERFPQWDFVLVGEVTHGNVRALQKCPNVEFVGEVPYASLPGYLHAFDVCVIPFLINELTRCTNPVKIYEYLAAGKPVVTTDMPELRLIDDVCHVASDGEAFLSLLERAMAESGDVALAEKRRQWASRHDWQERVGMLTEAIDGCWPKISVVILTYNNLDFTRACLRSVEKYTRYPNAEIIIVDNASTDETPAFLEAYQERHPEVKVILNGDNKGFAAGNNVGLRAATGDYLVILNNDTYVTEGWLHGLVRHLERDPGLGLIGPVTNNIGNEAKIDIDYQSMDEMRQKARAYTERHLDNLLEVDNIAFFCAAMSREVFDVVGGLDEDFGLGFFEDDDYCRRVTMAGYRIAIANDVFVHHHLSASFNKLGDRKRQEIFLRNKAVYEKKWGKWKPHRYRKVS